MSVTQTRTIESTALTDSGRVRTINCDTVLSREATGSFERLQKGSIWVITDGLGAGEKSQEASQLAANFIVDSYWNSAIPNPLLRLKTVFDQANSLLFNEAEVRGYQPATFGATAVVAVIVDTTLYVAHVGRSRAYRYRSGMLEQLTQDHSWVASMLRAGELTPQEAANHPRRNVITRCLGIKSTIRTDLIEKQLNIGDIILLCSDGLHRDVDDGYIVSALQEHEARAPKELIAEANRRGGNDNISAVAIKVVESKSDRSVPLPESTDTDRIALLSKLGYEITQSLDLDETLKSSLKQFLALSGGERAAIMLIDDDDQLTTRASYVGSSEEAFEDPSHSVAYQSLDELRPILVDNPLNDPNFQQSESIILRSLRSILCVPMIIQERAIGVLYVDSASESVQFSEADQNLLVSFASQAAAAIQNAQLHDEILMRSKEIELASQRQDALFRSISSAIVAVDQYDTISEWNPAASEIFETSSELAIGKPLGSVLPTSLVIWMKSLYAQLESGNVTVFAGNEWEGQLGSRERVVLAARVAKIREENEALSGFVFVINDRTDIVLIEEARKSEKEEGKRLHGLFSRYLAPQVVEQIMKSPDSVRLGGDRHNITVLFADVRGFTGYSERNSPETVVGVLNKYLELSTVEIFKQMGSIDKFLGDGVMALFGAPIELKNHEIAAIRAAMSMSSRLSELRKQTGVDVGFGIGINSGSAIVGNIGAPQLMSYTAIGDVVNVAARLESEARAGEVLVSDDTLTRVGGQVVAEELGSIYVKGRTEPVKMHKVLRVLGDS